MRRRGRRAAVACSVLGRAAAARLAAAHDRALRYLAGARASPEGRARAARRRGGRARRRARPLGEPAATPTRETLRAVRELVVERFRHAGRACHGTRRFPRLAGRRQLAARRLDARAPDPRGAASRRCRRSVAQHDAARRLERRFFRARMIARDDAPSAAEATDAAKPGAPRRQRAGLPWTRRAARRRRILILLVLSRASSRAGSCSTCCPSKGGNSIELRIVVFFGALFGWISIGFWTALLRLLSRSCAGEDRFTITQPGRRARRGPRPSTSRRARRS